uniref:Uncharacterized protein n=1 Tax=Setaria italica TaxID=4555 RepID=K3Y2G2_SETIT
MRTRLTCGTWGIIGWQVPRQEEAAGCGFGRQRSFVHHQIIGPFVHNPAPVHIDAEDALLQGEVDQVGLGRAHGGEHGNPPWQLGRPVAVVVPDLLEAHRVGLLPLPPSLTEDHRPHVHRHCTGLTGDLHVPQVALAHRDAAMVEHARRRRGQGTVRREAVEEQSIVVPLHVAADDPPREVEPPHRGLEDDGAVGSPLPVPVLCRQRGLHVLVVPLVVARVEGDERGAVAAPVNLELGDREAAVSVGDEADAKDAGELGDEAGADRAVGDALGGCRDLAVGRSSKVAGHDEVGVSGVVAEKEPDGGRDGEVGEEAVGRRGDDPGAPVEAVGVGVGAAARGEDGDPGQRRDREGEVWRSSRCAGGELRADGAIQEHPRRRHGGLVRLASFRQRASEREGERW